MKKVHSVLPAPYSHWVGDGFPAKSLFSYNGQGHAISPFLLLDHAGPMEFSPSAHNRGVGEHPHRGFETVTIVYSGELAHKDSTGESSLIREGDIQWMTAGAGILHEEFHSDAFSKSGGLLEMIQLWVNLPKSKKMTAPTYQTITSDIVPDITLPEAQGKLRVIAGEYEGKQGTAHTHSPLLVMDGVIKASTKYQLSVTEGWTAIVIVRKGRVVINQEEITTGKTIILSQQGSDIEMEALTDSEFLFLSGEPINEPIVGYGPFVMNNEADIKQAMLDFQSGKFGKMKS